MVSLEVGIKIFLKKPLQDQEGMEVFPKTKKVHLEIYNIHCISFFFFFSDNSHSGDSHENSSTASKISFQ